VKPRQSRKEKAPATHFVELDAFNPDNVIRSADFAGNVTDLVGRPRFDLQPTWCERTLNDCRRPW
jgi:hypothetical protein